MKKLLIALATLAGVMTAPALTVDSTVSDHCVLLQNAQNTVKGTTTAGRTVTVKLGGTQVGSATADSSGNYAVKFNPGSANATGRSLVVSDGSASQTISDVLVGEVWFVAGQSNAFNMMDGNVMTADYKVAYPVWKEQFDCPNVRVVISTPTQAAGGVSDYYQAAPSQNLNWIVCQKSNEANVKKISPLAFFFGKKLSEHKNCPVGIVLVGQGGTPIGYHLTAEGSALAKRYFGGDYGWGDGFSNGRNFSACYTRTDTIAARGVIWAQGETDGKTGGGKYRYLLQALVENWRSRRNQPNLPFLIYGFANYDNEVEAEGEGKWPLVRWEQEKAVADGLITPAAVFHAIDLSGSSQQGYAKAIHPDQKPDLAARALLAARNLVYGESNVAYRCPYPTQAYFNSDKSKVYVTFPSSVSLTMTGSYTQIPFRIKNRGIGGWGTSVRPTSVKIGADGHSLEISFDNTKLSLGTSDLSNSIDYCCVAGTEPTTYIYEQLIKDQNGFPMPPFAFNISNAASSTDTHTHTWGTPTYTWNADDTICTASAKCTQDASHAANQSVNATLTVTKEATTTSTGTGTRTAVFTSPFTTQTKSVTIPVKTDSGSGSGSSDPVVPGDSSAAGVQLWANGPYWATKNVGAASETDAGKFYMWGDLTGYSSGDSNIPFGDETKSVTSGKSLDQLKSGGYVDANGNLATAYDAAAMTMGGTWRMPTYAEWEALTKNCTFAWDSAKKVLVVTGKDAYSNAQIYLPCPGYWNTTAVPPVLFNQNVCSYYFSSTPDSGNLQKARGVTVQQGGTYAGQSILRYSGYCVRAVSSTDPGSSSGSGESGGEVTPGGDTHTHNWGSPSYSWSSDNKSCTGTRSCSGCTQKDTKTVSSTYEVVLTATDTADGKGRYTAAFTSPFATQTKDVTIAKTGSDSGSGSGSAGTNDGHEGIQLWANGPYWGTMNCGATKIGEQGYFYAGPGDVKGKSVKNGALTGSLVDNTSSTMWGGDWRKPTESDWNALISNTEVVGSEVIDGQVNVKLRGKADAYKDKVLYIPAAGWGNNNSVNANPNCWGTQGRYWGSTPSGSFMRNLSIIVGSSSVKLEVVSNHAQNSNIYTVRMCCDTVTGGGTTTHTHTWGTPSYAWTQTSTGWTCKASVSCTGDSSHTKEQTATATYAVVTEATTTAEGKGRYTATFTDTTFATQTKDVTIEKKPSSGGQTGGQTGGETTDPTPAFGSANYYVSTTGSDSNNGNSRATAFATITKAVSVANDGQKICLLKGTYNVVNASPYTDSAAIVLNKGVVIFGETGNPADVVVHNTKEWADNANYNQTYRVFLLNHADAVVSGITIENGFVRGGQTEPKFYGGNVLINSNGGTVENCVIRNGRIDTYQNATADPNTAGAGAAIACISANGLISHCVISNNLGSMGRTHSTKKNVEGSTIVWLKPGTLRQSLIVNNTIRQSWWGSIVHLGSAGALAENCTIANNRYDSSTVGNPGSWADSGELYPVNITLNAYDTGAAEGIVRNCVIVNNSGHSGRELSAFSRYLDSTYGNTKKGVARNNIINCATDCTLPSEATAVTSGFALGADFRPQAGSTLIDAGATMASPVAADLAGCSRIHGSAVDIGCYEYGSSAPTPPPAHTHVWGAASYEWIENASGYSCKASQACSGCSETKSETVTASYAVVTAATTAAAGTGRYTATFADAAFATQTKDVVIPKLHAHTYGTPTYSWSADYRTCTASVQCTASGCGDTITETVNTTANVTKEPTTEATGTCIYTATFVNSNFARQTKTVTLPKRPSGPNANGYDYVQLWKDGPYWAKVNVGAASETAVGNYYSWGSTTAFDGSTCATMNKSVDQLAEFLDANGNLKSAYDAASANMGGDWRMPTKEEMDDLVANCDVSWDATLKGAWVQGRGDFASVKIFLPNGGYHQNNGGVINNGIYGFYLSSTPNTNTTQAKALVSQAVNPLSPAVCNRNNGYPIRGVLPYVPGSNPGTGEQVDWEHPVMTIAANTTADVAWPSLANSALAAANAAQLQTWAMSVGKVAFESADDIKVDAFLLNCANTDAAINAAKAEFKFTSFDPENLPKASDFADKGYNGVVTIEGRKSLESGTWGPKSEGDRFFRAILSL